MAGISSVVSEHERVSISFEDNDRAKILPFNGVSVYVHFISNLYFVGKGQQHASKTRSPAVIPCPGATTVQEGRISIRYCHKEHQVAEIRIKPLSKHGFRYPIKLMRELQP